MGYPTTGLQGSIASWGTGGNFYATLLARMTSAAATISLTNEPVDVGGLGVQAAVMRAGLSSATVEITGFLDATPRLGNVGLIAFSAGGYTQHLRGYELEIRTLQTHDITTLVGPSGAPEWRAMRPDGHGWSASVEAIADSGTAGPLPLTPTGTNATVTMTYLDQTTDASFAGSGFISSSRQQVQRGQLNTIEYTVTGAGALTPAGTTSPFGTTALSTPLWSEGGSAAGPMVIATLTGSRTYTLADSFWTRLRLGVRVGEPVSIGLTVQATGAVTVA